MVNDDYARVRKIKFKRKNLNKDDVENTSKEFSIDNSLNKIPNINNTDHSCNNLKKQGEGRIISSNTTVQGFHTKFQQELQVGDILEIEHPNTLIREGREIVNIISERTLIIEREFSSDLVSTCNYYYIRKEGKDIQEHKDNAISFSYREKDGKFKYKTVVKFTDKKLSREDILDIRAKKQRDKYCWI